MCKIIDKIIIDKDLVQNLNNNRDSIKLRSQSTISLISFHVPYNFACNGRQVSCDRINIPCSFPSLLFLKWYTRTFLMNYMQHLSVKANLLIYDRYFIIFYASLEYSVSGLKNIFSLCKVVTNFVSQVCDICYMKDKTSWRRKFWCQFWLFVNFICFFSFQYIYRYYTILIHKCIKSLSNVKFHRRRLESFGLSQGIFALYTYSRCIPIRVVMINHENKWKLEHRKYQYHRYIISTERWQFLKFKQMSLSSTITRVVFG